MPRKVIASNICPPIPSRDYDWVAHREGWDLGEPIGYGATKEEAIKELLEMELE